MKEMIFFVALVIASGFAHSIYGQNNTPVANTDLKILYTNSGANTVDVQANDVDDSPILVTTITVAPLHGVALVLGGDSIVYTPDSNYCGLDSLTYQICDNGLPSLCDLASVVFTVSPVDSDGDGLNDVFETYTGDADVDSVPNYLDIDSDNDGISDLFEANQILSCNPTPPDTDNDGVPNYLDLDSDNDGRSDLLEAADGTYDIDDNGIIDNLSSFDGNSNGMPDLLEASADRDFDGDGIPDRLDLDSDDDGLADVLESGFLFGDTNGDGTINASDASGGDIDGDGIADAIDTFNGPGFAPGSQNESLLNRDNDGLLNSNDLDSDNDGSGDNLESALNAFDTDADGVVNGTDTDGDGMINIAGLDGNASFGGDPGSQVLTNQDNDGDGTIDAQDLDSDNDGISDVFENGFGTLDANNDGVLDSADTDNDGFVNGASLDINAIYGADLGSQDIGNFDFEVDGSINSEDLDNDNDGIGDLLEIGFGNLDADNNGVIDGTDDDNDGFINNTFLDNNLTFGGKLGTQDETTNDYDLDGRYDFFDWESDGDTIPDVYEGGFGAFDVNQDGMVDGTDTDGDGVINIPALDSTAAYGFNAGSQNDDGIPYMDADSDQHINSEDLNSDGDGLSDYEEWDSNGDKTGNDDCDLNAIPDYLDPSSCELDFPNAFSPNGDGINDIFNIQAIDVYPNNKFSIFNRWGVVVFEAQPYNNDWDGTSTVLGALGGGALPVGTYFYVLDLGDGSTPMSGYIYLNR